MLTSEILTLALDGKEVQFFDKETENWIDFNIEMPLDCKALSAEWRRKPLFKTIEGFIFPVETKDTSVIVYFEKSYPWMEPAKVTYEVTQK